MEASNNLLPNNMPNIKEALDMVHKDTRLTDATRTVLEEVLLMIGSHEQNQTPQKLKAERQKVVCSITKLCSQDKSHVYDRWHLYCTQEDLTDAAEYLSAGIRTIVAQVRRQQARQKGKPKGLNLNTVVQVLVITNANSQRAAIRIYFGEAKGTKVKFAEMFKHWYEDNYDRRFSTIKPPKSDLNTQEGITVFEGRLAEVTLDSMLRDQNVLFRSYSQFASFSLDMNQQEQDGFRQLQSQQLQPDAGMSNSSEHQVEEVEEVKEEVQDSNRTEHLARNQRPQRRAKLQAKELLSRSCGNVQRL